MRVVFQNEYNEIGTKMTNLEDNPRYYILISYYSSPKLTKIPNMKLTRCESSFRLREQCSALLQDIKLM